MAVRFNIHIEHLFATMLVIDRLQGTLPDAAALASALKGAPSVRGMARTCHWESGWPEPLQPLVDHALMLAARATVDVSLPSAPMDWRVAVAAYAVAPGEQLDLDPVYEAYWICAFVLEDGYGGASDPSLGGELVFVDPRLPAPMMEMPDLRLRLVPGAQGAVYAPEVLLRPGTGSVIMYPGWMRIRHHMLGDRADRRFMVSVSLVAPLGRA